MAQVHTTSCPVDGLPDGFDSTDPEMWRKGIPVEELAKIRNQQPVWWNAQSGTAGGFHDGGFWLITKHADVKDVSLRSEIFSSHENTAIPRFQDDIEREQIDMQRILLLNKDAPEHTVLRKLISKGFTPRVVNGLRAELLERAESIVTAAKEAGHGDFVTNVAAELPLQAIAALIGVPQEDRGKLFQWSNDMTGYDDPDSTADPLVATTEILGYAYQMAEARKANPESDIATALVNADVNGESLTSEEFGFFVILLAVAGNETTRNAITQGMMAFMEHPDQWEIYKEQRPKTAADEIIRWATPVSAFQRTALEDTEIGGVQIKKGQRVVMNYRAANFDEDVFTDPLKFDILRDPNPHVSFGGTGAHYCIGANLARMEIDLIFNAIADHLPNIVAVGDPRRLQSGWLNAIKEYPMDFTGNGCPVQH